MFNDNVETINPKNIDPIKQPFCECGWNRYRNTNGCNEKLIVQYYWYNLSKFT